MSRGVFLLGVGVALVALGLSATDRALSLLPGITEANTRRICVGMTLFEVETKLGGPPTRRFRDGPNAGPYFLDAIWEGKEGTCRVLFRQDTWHGTERATDVFYISKHNGFIARLRTWFGW
jgi:hypothetical protein